LERNDMLSLRLSPAYKPLAATAHAKKERYGLI